MIPAKVFNEMRTDAILQSIDIALQVLKSRRINKADLHLLASNVEEAAILLRQSMEKLE